MTPQLIAARNRLDEAERIHRNAVRNYAQSPTTRSHKNLMHARILISLRSREALAAEQSEAKRAHNTAVKPNSIDS